jgi:hypothetical protein
MWTSGKLSQQTAQYGVAKLRPVHVYQKDTESFRNKTHVWPARSKSQKLWSLTQLTHVLLVADLSATFDQIGLFSYLQTHNLNGPALNRIFCPHRLRWTAINIIIIIIIIIMLV